LLTGHASVLLSSSNSTAAVCICTVFDVIAPSLTALEGQLL
jgi:hypothetical protein